MLRLQRKADEHRHRDATAVAAPLLLLVTTSVALATGLEYNLNRATHETSR